MVFYQHNAHNKGIISIEYNHLNLPQKIVFSQNREIHFAYTAEGQKLSKTLYVDNEKIATRYYAAGMEYRNDTLDFVSQPEGRVLVLPGDTLRYEYNIRDHLGDTRVTFSDLDHNGLIETSKGEIIQESHYDPWGFELTGIWQKQRDTLHPTAYLYNNKEFNEDFDLNWSDYGARWYDAAVGRWWVVDPMAEKSRRWSPYNYGLDNPVRFVDPDGLAPETVKPSGKTEEEKQQVLQMIKNTLTSEDSKFVRLDADGNIDKDRINSQSSDSENFSSLKVLVNSEMVTEVYLDDKYDSVDAEGTSKSSSLFYDAPDETSDKDIEGNTMGGTSTGESGFLGKTLFPDKNGLENSPDGTLKIIVDKNLSESGRAEIYSHEANGHAYIYIASDCGRERASHNVPNGMKELNTELKVRIVQSKKETIKNMKNQ